MRRIVLAALAIIAALGLAACSDVDRQQSIVCVAVATAIGPDGRPVTIRSVEPLTGATNAVRVIFTAAGDPRTLFADCVFAGGSLSAGRTDILAVRGFSGRMPEWRLGLLKRWFLEQPGAVQAAVGEAGWAPPRYALLPVALPATAGYALQQVVNALNVAAFYVPLALAYALIYGLVGRLNMAFGDFAMIGGFGAVFGLVTAATAHVPSLVTVMLVALAASVSLTALFGYLTARTVVMPLLARPPRASIVATVGLGIAVSEAVRIAQGSREIWLQPMLGDQVLIAGGPFPVVVTVMRLAILALSALAVVWLFAILARSTFGRAWRAVADDALAARLFGIDPVAVTGVTFILASALASLSGSILALGYGGTSFSAGLMLGLKALIACLIGGGTPRGALIGALLLAAIETGWSAVFGLGERDIAVLAIITLLFLLRPDGLFGRRPTLEEGRPIRLS